MKLSERRRFLILFILTLVLFSGGGFFLGFSGLLDQLREANRTKVVLLTEKNFLFPDFFHRQLEEQFSIRFEIEIAEDPDSFLEKAADADLLWARKDWILKTELHLKDFKSSRSTQDTLVRSLSADFFDPEETSSTLLPILWTLPVMRVKEALIKSEKDFAHHRGDIRWPFWGLREYFSEVPEEGKGASEKEEAWILFPSSTQTPEIEKFGDPWFPEQKIRPLVICLAFVENDRLSSSLKERLVQAWIEPKLLAKLAAESQMAITLVQAEELLPPWQRASALRKIGLTHLERP
jgi:hypothetical protein